MIMFVTMIRKGQVRLKRSQISTGLMLAVLGRLPDTERYTEASTIMHVLTKKGLKENEGQICSHVDGVDKAVLVVSGDIVGGLVDNVHQDGGQVGDHEDTLPVSIEIH